LEPDLETEDRDDERRDFDDELEDRPVEELEAPEPLDESELEPLTLEPLSDMDRELLRLELVL